MDVTGGGEDPAQLAQLRARLITYGSVIAGLALSIIVIVFAAELAYSMPSHWATRPAGRGHVVSTLVLCALLALLLFKTELSGRALRTVDLGITLTIALMTAHATWVEVPRAATTLNGWAWTPDQSHELKSFLLLGHLLLFRAAVVPSRKLRTALIGTLAALPVCVATQVGYASVHVPPGYGSVPLVNAIVWSSFSVAVSTACSGVIYGLRRQVRDAMRLGQYTLEGKVGQGGMGVVYRARHALLRRPTAVKVLLAERVGERTLERFEREVQLTAKLSHPNIVSVYDFGRSQDGTFYYAMEFLDGIDLQHLVEASGPQPPGRVIAILRQAAEALAEAHAVRLIHRDIKPANMILTRRASNTDVLKVVDFGLVKEIEAADGLSESHVRELRGTPHYMAPEAFLAPASVGPPSDLYALGAVGYFLLTGTPVFDGKSTFAVLGKHAHVAPVPPSQRVAEVPQKLEAVILRCLEKTPERRYADANELCRALDACDDVTPWTRPQALAWWQEHRVSERPAPSARPGQLLTIDLGARAPGKS